MDTGKICASPLWNESISWNTPDPYFSECFKHLILVIGSCAVLWLVAPFEFIKICRYRGSPHPWSTLSVAKIVCKVLLLVICVIELAKEVYAYVTQVKAGLDGLIAAVAYLITIALTVVITLMCKKRGLRSSLALPSFWMISTITTLITIYDDIHGVDQSSWVSLISLVDDCTVFVISLVQLILSNLSETGGTSTYGRELMNYCPLDGCPLFSRLTFSWILGLLNSSTKKTLHPDDLIPLCSEFRSIVVAGRFHDVWDGNFRERSISFQRASTDYQESNETLYQSRGDNLNQLGTSVHGQRRKRSLLTALSKISALYLMIASIFEVFYTALYFLPVYILSLILKNTEEPKWHIYLFATVLFINILLITVVDSQRKYYGLISAFKIKTAVMNAIFEKTFVSQRPQNAEKLLLEDSEQIFQMVCLQTEVWGTPLRIILGLYLLWSFLGSSCFVGMGAAALLIPLIILIGTIASHYKSQALESKSEWISVLSECLHGIRCLKLYAWEDFFLRKINALRKSEVSKLKRTKFLRILFKLFLLCSTSLVSLATFFVFVIMTDSFDMKIIFLAYFTIWLLKSPFTNILRLLAHFIQGLSAISRIESFLEAKDIENLSPPDNDSEYKISLQNAAFSWADDKEFRLGNLTFNIKDESLVAIIGESLSGKSSLLRALLGEMKKLEGTTYVKGDIAFVSENPWIQNAALEENILFGRHRVDSIYSNLLEACDLHQDVENLPAGEETQIGEKGYPLNDVQELKVDLARAAYQNAEIYLLDDLFKCTDTDTAEHLFERVVSHRGILKKKIRIFTTNDTKFLPSADHVIFLKDGQIVEQGDYVELMEKCGAFAEYLKNESHEHFSKNKYQKSNNKQSDLSFGNFKYHCEPWYSATELNFTPEIDSFMQNEIMTAPKALLRKMLDYVKMYSYIFTVIAVVAAILANCCEVMSLTWWAWRTSEYEENQKMHIDLYIFTAFIASQVLFCLICGIMVSWGNTKAIEEFYKWLLNRIMKAPLITFGTLFVDRVLQSFDKDLQFADEEIPIGFYVWLVTLMKVPVLLVLIFVNSPLLCLLSLYLIGFLYIIQRLYMNAWRQLHYLTTSTRCPLSNLMQNVFQGISNIRTSKASIPFISRFHSKLDAYNKCNFLFLLASRWMSSSVEIIGSIFILLVTLTIIYIKGPGNYFTGLVIVFAMQVPECLVSILHLSSMLDIDSSYLERFLSFSDVKQESEWENQISVPWLKSGSIIIRNLSTIYGEGLYPVLNNISIAVRPEEKVAIVGKEDSGISTILDSLFRIREISEGQIFIDNVDICHISLHDLRSKLGIIPQDPLIFNGTLRENLDPEQNYNDTYLQMALKTAEVSPDFSDLDNVIGNNVSTEEKYQIALARCLLKMSKIVIIDGYENSRRGDKHFQNSTLVSFGNSRLLDNYDRIICISSGEIVEVISSPA